MSKSRGKKSRRNLIAIIIFVGALSYAGFRYLYPPKPANIFLINPVPIQYGDTTITGKLQKDTAIGIEGNYLLVLADGKLILLDIQGLDSFVGQSITISGTLSPASAKGLPMTMTITSIKTNPL